MGSRSLLVLSLIEVKDCKTALGNGSQQTHWAYAFLELEFFDFGQWTR
jgi:hypothetical protein